MDTLFEPMRLFMRLPFLALVPAVLLIGAALVPRIDAPRIVLWAGVLWGVYALWETAVYFWTRAQPADGGTPIRVDLLLITPVLYLATLAALVLWARAALSG